ncbi:uncharacterized protein BO97DRAFT_183176 [Aspergillus homomorphus CBS 101889]|uniref:Uncharacterized protein n=1 Tax=Aspergillus homomorphus (strain CBS 101889) TaxID=1450537 RepID=A0A395ID60_ASPHC|nr:hypothetical protein BO97DRAFT_183176 [Aspergillus homomorphus CBS 101889]RAL16104.1 hypothetical protein BO97DRAFT_183176 [Aspergillus homomorphus CBS 101889]
MDGCADTLICVCVHVYTINAVFSSSFLCFVHVSSGSVSNLVQRSNKKKGKGNYVAQHNRFECDNMMPGFSVALAGLE